MQVMQINDWLANAAQHPVPTEEEVIILSRTIQDGKQGLVSKAKYQAAVTRLVRGNLLLVGAIWKRRYLKRGVASLHSLELLQEGAIGLYDAAIRFDPTKGYRFSTYANNWIVKSMKEFQRDKERLVRFKSEMHWKALKAVRMTNRNLDERHSPEEIEEALKMPMDRALELARLFVITAAMSLDIDDDNKDSMHERIADPNSVEIETDVPDAYRLAVEIFDRFEVEPRLRELIMARYTVRKTAKGWSNAASHCTKADQGRITSMVNKISRKLREEGVTLASLMEDDKAPLR